MSKLFDDAMAAVNVALDGVFGEDFLLFPQTVPDLPSGRPDVDARPVSSTTRNVIAFRGAWIAPGAEPHAMGRAMADRTTRPIVTDKPMIDVDAAALASAVDGDLVQRVATGETLRVAKLMPGDIGRAWLHLDHITKPASVPR